MAHVYDSSGRSLAAAQLRAGMAMQIAVPPNIAQAQCLAAIEPDARKAQLGIWRDRYWQPLPSKAMRGAEVGFRLVSGRVAKVDINSAVWLELEGKLVLKVAKRDWQAFGYSKQDWLDFKGRKLEVRGWVSAQQSRRSQQFKPLVMQLRSPAAVSVIAD